ncbi:hypothetical protein M885DRAFT_534143 [Pelagophyceae sp. CCMP2097]|nr:hypothetical protein M885DRAFT_534143 [Pelagophyceae sp. CCMP2097]
MVSHGEYSRTLVDDRKRPLRVRGELLKKGGSKSGLGAFQTRRNWQARWFALDVDLGELRYYEDAALRNMKGLVQLTAETQLEEPAPTLKGKHARTSLVEELFYFELTMCKDEKGSVRPGNFQARAKSQPEMDEWRIALIFSIRLLHENRDARVQTQAGPLYTQLAEAVQRRSTCTDNDTNIALSPLTLKGHLKKDDAPTPPPLPNELAVALSRRASLSQEDPPPSQGAPTAKPPPPPKQPPTPQEFVPIDAPPPPPAAPPPPPPPPAAPPPPPAAGPPPPPPLPPSGLPPAGAAEPVAVPPPPTGSSAASAPAPPTSQAASLSAGSRPPAPAPAPGKTAPPPPRAASSPRSVPPPPATAPPPPRGLMPLLVRPPGAPPVSPPPVVAPPPRATPPPPASAVPPPPATAPPKAKVATMPPPPRR